MRKQVYFCLFSFGILAPQLFCQVAPSKDRVISAGAAAVDDLKTLRERIAQQSEQIKKLQGAVEEQRKLLDQAVQAAESRAETRSQEPVIVPAATSSAAPLTLEPAVDRGRRGGIVPGRGGQNLQSRNPSPLGIS